MMGRITGDLRHSTRPAFRLSWQRLSGVIRRSSAALEEEVEASLAFFRNRTRSPCALSVKRRKWSAFSAREGAPLDIPSFLRSRMAA
jgi:hypothetical protein